MKVRFRSVKEVGDSELCMGCGACAGVCREGAVSIVDFEDSGMRVVADEGKCKNCGRCLAVCPGIEISSAASNGRTISELRKGWGPVLEVWEGYAADPEIRFKASSGGLVSSLALYCLEKEAAASVLHIGADPENPLRNIAVFSTDRDQLLACAGSRYSPARPCEKLNLIEQKDLPSVFVGKPCDVAALRKSVVLRPELKGKVLLAISIFCAGTPATAWTYRLLDVFGVKADEVKQIRYRGLGWPGETTIRLKTSGQILKMSYERAWGQVLSKGESLRCRLCPDSTGELADISFGDGWHRKSENNQPGWSLALVRTERARTIFHKAIEAGYITASKTAPDALIRSQSALLRRRQNVWGRLQARRFLRQAVPSFSGFSLKENWADLGGYEKFRSVAGTLKRIAVARSV